MARRTTAATLDFDLGDLGRVQRKLSLDAFAADDPPHHEHLARARAAAGDHHAVEDLNAFLLTFENSGVHVDRVANLEVGNLGLQAALFDQFQGLLTHDS